MVQLVFIHGVNVRRTPDPQAYDEDVAQRHGLFLKDCFGGGDHGIYDPYWGHKGAEPKLGGLYLEFANDDTLFAVDPYKPLKADVLTRSEKGSSLLREARADFEATLNSLALRLAEIDIDEPDGERIANYVVAREVSEGGIAAPAWLFDPALENDQDFLLALEDDLAPAWAAGRLQQMADQHQEGRFRTKARRRGLIARLGRNISPVIARFLGDAFVYLGVPQRRKEIQDIILADIKRAALAAKARNEPLIILGHSMGATIFYDMISNPTVMAEFEQDLGFDFRPDLFLSVGAQLGLFEELDLFHSSSAGPAPFPTRLEHWWHVYDYNDVLSFAAKGIFVSPHKQLEQFSINTNASVFTAHGAYFKSKVFYKKLQARLKKAGIHG